MVRGRFSGPSENSREQRTMNRFWKWTLGSFLGLLVLVFAGLSFMAGSPRDVYGLVRYALPHLHRGRLNPGDDAPDVRLLALRRLVSGGATVLRVRKVYWGRRLGG